MENSEFVSGKSGACPRCQSVKVYFCLIWTTVTNPRTGEQSVKEFLNVDCQSCKLNLSVHRQELDTMSQLLLQENCQELNALLSKLFANLTRIVKHKIFAAQDSH